MPRTADGEFYTTRIEDDDADRIGERLVNSARGIRIGARIGALAGPPGQIVGATLGGISGFILGDQTTVFPVDMIAIPAYQAYMLNGQPSFTIYIKEGEVLTQVQPTDAMQANAVMSGEPMPMLNDQKKKRKPSKWNRYTAKTSNQIKFKTGKKKGLLNLKAMSTAYHKANGTKKPRKKGGKK